MGEPVPERIWVVLGEGGEPDYCASYPEACHEHINDAIEQGITEAARWVVREFQPTAEGPVCDRYTEAT